MWSVFYIFRICFFPPPLRGGGFFLLRGSRERRNRPSWLGGMCVCVCVCVHVHVVDVANDVNDVNNVNDVSMCMLCVLRVYVVSCQHDEIAIDATSLIDRMVACHIFAIMLGFSFVLTQLCMSLH